MVMLTRALKLKIPGYRKLWKNRSQCFIDHLAEYTPKLNFGIDDGTPFLEQKENGLRFYGFVTDPKSEDLFSLISQYVPIEIPQTHYRLVKDYINRYVYPHMRPELNISGYSHTQMAGFHGQHKDSIQNLPTADQERLTEAFTPNNDDVVIDCGPFIGFGSIRMSEDIPQGRIVAVEASKQCFDFLQRNFSENNIACATPIHRAVWNELTEMELESGFAQANSLVKEVHEGLHTQMVKTITIDQIVIDYNLSKVDMLSLTLNGAEIEALDGAKDVLSNKRPRIRLAGWYERGGETIASLTKQILEQYDYQVFVGPRNNVLALPR